MDKQNKRVKVWCKRCNNVTNHDELYTANWNLEDDYYVYKEQYSIVRCCGCDNLSFLLTVYDESNEDYDENGMQTITPQLSIYPIDRVMVNRIDANKIPHPVREIYLETIDNINRKNSILGAAGCRAVIEAICKEHEVAGRDLNTMINNMAKNHIITAKDRDHLHAIRFMGNDSIHVSCKYPENELKIVAHIINSILTSLYIIAEESKHLKELPIDNFNDFLLVLENILDSETLGVQKTLKQLTKSKRTLLDDYINQFEPQLIANINSGTFTRLSLVLGTSPQAYIVVGGSSTTPNP